MEELEGIFGCSPSPVTIIDRATAADLFHAVRAYGGGFNGPPVEGWYHVVIAKADVQPNAIRLELEILDGPSAGDTFTPFRMNWTDRGIRRAAKVLRAWGIEPQGDDTRETLAEKLLGRRARVRVEHANFGGKVMADTPPESIQLIKENT
jgi:hypothetical protein